MIPAPSIPSSQLRYDLAELFRSFVGKKVVLEPSAGQPKRSRRTNRTPAVPAGETWYPSRFESAIRHVLARYGNHANVEVIIRMDLIAGADVDFHFREASTGRTIRVCEDLLAVLQRRTNS